MEFTVTTKGPTLDKLSRDLTRQLKSANRAAGRVIGKAGKTAVDGGAPRMMGRQLKVKAKTTATATKAAVEFTPAKGQSGAWAIAEAGRRGGYTVKARRGRAVKFDGRYASVTHPGRVAGRMAWTRAAGRLVDAVDDAARDHYAEALGAK